MTKLHHVTSMIIISHPLPPVSTWRKGKKGRGDESGGLCYWTLDVIDPLCASQPHSRTAKKNWTGFFWRDWRPPFVSDDFKVAIKTRVHAAALAFPLQWAISGCLECTLPVSWQVTSGAKQKNLQHTRSSVSRKQKERETNDTSVTSRRDEHNSAPSPPHPLHWKHAQRLLLVCLLMFQNKSAASPVQNAENSKSEDGCQGRISHAVILENAYLWVLIISLIFSVWQLYYGKLFLIKMNLVLLSTWMHVNSRETKNL